MSKIIIVGGSSGIGLALAQKLSETNDIVNISRTPCSVSGVTNITADVTDEAAISGAFAAISDADALIYCAGISMAASVEHVRRDDYRELFDVNLLGAVECVRLALPLLNRSQDGRIILLGSSGAITPIAFDGFYSASKAALNMFSYALNIEQTKVKCTAAVIGGTRTRFSFKRNVYGDCGELTDDLRRATAALIKIEQTGYTADLVADKLIDLLHDKNPPPVATIGFKNKLAMAVYRILPYPLKLRVLRHVYKLNS